MMWGEEEKEGKSQLKVEFICIIEKVTSELYLMLNE